MSISNPTVNELNRINEINEANRQVINDVPINAAFSDIQEVQQKMGNSDIESPKIQDEEIWSYKDVTHAAKTENHLKSTRYQSDYAKGIYHKSTPEETIQALTLSEKAKNFFKNNKKKIIIAGTLAGLVIAYVASITHIQEQGRIEYVENNTPSKIYLVDGNEMTEQQYMELQQAKAADKAIAGQTLTTDDVQALTGKSFGI